MSEERQQSAPSDYWKQEICISLRIGSINWKSMGARNMGDSGQKLWRDCGGRRKEKQCTPSGFCVSWGLHTDISTLDDFYRPQSPVENVSPKGHHRRNDFGSWIAEALCFLYRQRIATETQDVVELKGKRWSMVKNFTDCGRCLRMLFIISYAH